MLVERLARVDHGRLCTPLRALIRSVFFTFFLAGGGAVGEGVLAGLDGDAL
jgi:hypothetical protein